MMKDSDTKNNISTKFNDWFISIQQDRSIRVFVKLVKRLRQQSLFWQIITTLFIIIFGTTIVIFFSSYFIWFVLKFIFLQILLRGAEWYLNITENTKKTDIKY